MMNSILAVVVLWRCMSVAWSGSVSRGESGEVRLFRAPAAYDVETSVALNDISKKNKEVGYKIKAALHVLPVWAGAPDEYLLRFHLINPKLHLRGKHLNADFRPFDSIWDSYQSSEFYVHWKSGTIQKSYLDISEPVDILNYKKSLISLFQFQIIDGEFNETDISGVCDVLYDSISTDVFRKIKKRCIMPGTDIADTDIVSARRVTRYTLGAGELAGVYADELLELGDAALGVKARAWHRLQLAAARPPPAAPAAHPAAALPPHLAEAPLALAGDDPPEDDDMTLEAALAASRAALVAEAAEAAGAGGGAEHARAALRLLPPLRAADARALAALLHSNDSYPLLSGLCRMLGLAGTMAAHAAADAFLHLGARDPLQPLASVYLAAFALSDAPAPQTVTEIGRLAEEAKSPQVATGALLAATAAAGRLGDEELAARLRDGVARSLARCKDEACRAVRLAALGHLRRADDAELLLEHAERGARAPALRALDALAALPPHALPIARRRRLENIALRHGRPLEVRAAALDLMIKRGAARPLNLMPAAAALHRHGPVELRRLYWQRMRALADADDDVRALLAALPRPVRGWDAQALAGTSTALSRATGWRLGAWAARLDSLQVAAAGLLRRGRVQLLAHAPAQADVDELTVEVWTRGLEAVAGAGAADPRLHEAEAEAEAEAAEAGVAGGLALGVAGVALPPIDLFTGQAELLGHVWAGTGSTPTPALRALRPLPARAAVLPLLAGARVHASWRAATALALDAHAQVSLWSRNARSGLELRVGGAGEARVSLRTAWGELRARAAMEAEPRLRIAADLDFYDVVALCVRVRIDDYDQKRFSWQESSQGPRPLRVRRSLNATLPVAGRTLSLGRAGDAACRALTAADED